MGLQRVTDTPIWNNLRRVKEGMKLTTVSKETLFMHRNAFSQERENKVEK
jgi:hypothetical protein